MARTITQIQQAIISAKTADPTLGPALTSTSTTAIWLLWTYIVAVAQWTLENLFDQHKSEVQTIIATQTPHTLQWYVTKAKQFQFGYALPDGSDAYAVIDPTAQVVSFASAVELTDLIRIKAANLSGGVLAALSSPQLTALTTYMKQVKDAGVRLECTSGEADNLQVALNIYYDALVLDSTGARLDGSEATPVMDGINAFLASLPFNGLFVLNSMIEAVQAIPGVLICQVVTAQANYASTSYVTIAYEYTADAGYMALDETYFNAHVTYTAHAPL